MIAITIGLILIAALTSLLIQMSRTNREQFKSAQQIENGRYAIDLLSSDIKLAGFYGEFSSLPSIGAFTSQPDPCDINAASTGTYRLKQGTVTATTSDSPLAFYLQGYAASSLTTTAAVPTLCQAWIGSNSIKAGSDIIVVRRVDTIPLIDTPAPTPLPDSLSGYIYAQTTSDTLDIQYGAGARISSIQNNAHNVSSTLLRKDYSQIAPGGGTRPTVAAYIRKLHMDIYFVAPCSRGTGTNGNCTGSDDMIPTLKRLELTSSGGVPTLTVVPLVEGIEFLKVSYGIDNAVPVDGSVDAVVSAPSTIADWQNVVMVEIRLLARNNNESAGFTDPKVYDLGSGTFTPSTAEAKFKRHLFHQKIYLPTVAGRRET